MMEEHIEEETDAEREAKRQLSKAFADIQLWKIRYETESVACCEEIDKDEAEVAERLTETDRPRAKAEFDDLSSECHNANATVIEKRDRSFNKAKHKNKNPAEEIKDFLDQLGENGRSLHELNKSHRKRLRRRSYRMAWNRLKPLRRKSKHGGRELDAHWALPRRLLWHRTLWPWARRSEATSPCTGATQQALWAWRWRLRRFLLEDLAGGLWLEALAGGSRWRLWLEAPMGGLLPEARAGGSCLLVEALAGGSVEGSGWRLLWGGLLLEALGGGSCWRLSLEAMVEGSICECRMLSKRGLKRNLNPAWDVRGRMPASPR